jgi:hypothetical protein
MIDDPTARDHNRLLVAMLGGDDSELPVQAEATVETPDETDDQTFIRALFGGPAPNPPPDTDTDTDPDFDGGTRDTAPAPDNPEHDHGELLLDMIRQGNGA